MDHWLVLLLAFCAAGLVAGVVGFGSGLVGIAIIANLLPVTEAVVMLSGLSLLAPMLNAYTVRDHIDWCEVWPIVLTSLPMVVVGALLLQNLDARILRIGVAVMIVGGCAVMLWSPKRTLVHRTWPWGYLAAIFGGLFGGALAMGGPPVVLYSLARGWDKSESKALMSVFFVVMGFERLIVYFITGVATWEVVRLGLLLSVPAMLASYLGTRIFKHMSTALFRYAALALLLVLAAKQVLA